MKILNKNNLFFVLLFSLYFISTSCKKSGGEVVPDEKLKYLGTYSMIDRNNNNGEGSFKFKLTIKTTQKGFDKVELKGFRYVNNGILATITGDVFTIQQVLKDADEKVEVTGTGKLKGDTLTYSYVLKHQESGKAEKVYENTAEGTRTEE